MDLEIASAWHVDDQARVYQYRTSAITRGLFGIPRVYAVESEPLPVSVLRDSPMATIMRLCSMRVHESHQALEAQLLVDASWPLGAYLMDLGRILQAAGRMAAARWLMLRLWVAAHVH